MSIEIVKAKKMNSNFVKFEKLAENPIEIPEIFLNYIL